MNVLARTFSMIGLLGLSFGLHACQSNENPEATGEKTTQITEPVTSAVSNEPTKSSQTAGQKIIKVTTAEFKAQIFDYENETEWKYKGELPAIIDFYADWCAPCKMIAPTLEELQKEYKGQIQIYKVDVDKEQELAQVFQTQSIPSILFIPKTGQPQMAKGALPKETFVQAIADVLKVTQ